MALRGFVLGRLRDGAVVLLLVLAAVFVLSAIVGDPAGVMAPTDASEEEIARIAHQLGTDRPLLTQAGDYFGGVVTGDLGESTWQNRPALDVIADALPATIRLTLAGIAVAALLGVTFGVLAGARPGSRLDRWANVVATVGLSVPTFWLGLLLIVVFAVQLRLVPTSGDTEWKSLILPAATVGFEHGGRIFQLVRSAVAEEVSKPYVLVARSRGLSHRGVVGRHVLRNSGMLILTTVGWEYVRLWGGAVFAVEVVFAWPGIGQTIITATDRQDFPVVQAGVIVAGAFVVLANLAVDVLYRVVDRRVQVA
ncbi:MAG TPA: ABC transporter permease [Acidimicrobiales bacterium]|nr:ABC transporter permease [Acidimicrobiales bacterium]